ncbi:integrase catalytic domain-containing protein [Trichonephila clavipes]|nr:integrase catalytic domain-containing protein [Trichonephila clavipes]
MASNNIRIVLQGFADASEVAYGSVVYLQCFHHNGAAKVSILASKSRVAPIRVISIPRLELCACVLLAQLVKKMTSTLSDGLLRVGGQLSNSDLPYVNKYPAILPENHNLTVQIIAHFHRKKLHTGASSLLHYVREKFWPLNGRSLCRKVVHECLICFKSRPLLTSQLMGDLPRDRVVPDYPFNGSVVEFCGPFMISRRGKCAKLYSDNGKIFVGANKELKRFLKLIEDSDDNLAGFLSAESIEWKFIPPRAPSFGGIWEASVKSINDGAHFWLNGYVNKQNCRIWSEANSQVYVEMPLHPEKLTVWCALWAGGIIGPYFFKNDEGHNVTVNGDRYRTM